METENKDWKPEVGKTVWYLSGLVCQEVKVLGIYWHKANLGNPDLFVLNADISELFPTPEAALASIRVYDLEGKEILIPRAEPDFSLDEMVEFFNKWIKIDGNLRLFLEAQRKPMFTPQNSKYIDMARDIVNADPEAIAMRIMLSDEAGMLNYSWDQCLAMARRDSGGGAAIGGKSDQREGGC